MLQLLKSLYQSITQQRSYGSELENYIVAHNPVTCADVEHYERMYEYERKRTDLPFNPGMDRRYCI
jgi:hypothetical protein